MSINLGYSQKGIQHGIIARMLLLAFFFAFGIYVEFKILWWFLLAAVGCGVLIAAAIRRSGD